MFSRTLRLSYRLIRIAALEDRIELLSKKYPQVPIEDIKKLASVDPTHGKYLEWLVRGYHNWKAMLDSGSTHALDHIKDILTFYYKATRSIPLAEYVGLPLDISRLKAEDLYSAWVSFGREDLSTYRQRAEKAKKLGSRLIYSSGEYRVIQIGGEGMDPDYAATAACMYGRGTKWCTTNEGTAKNYLGRRPLYVIFSGKHKLLQTDGMSFMNVKDVTFDFTSDLEVIDVIDKSGILKEPMQVLDFVIALGNQGITRRLPHSENVFVKSGNAWEAVRYARMIHQRVPELEDFIAHDPGAAVQYAVEVIKGPFPQAEGILQQEPGAWVYYKNMLKYYADTSH